MLISEYNIKYVTQKAIKGQAIADHLVDYLTLKYEAIPTNFPDKTILEIQVGKRWKAYFDRASNQSGWGSGMIHVDPQGTHFPLSICLDFPNTNSACEWEECLRAVQMALDWGIDELEIYGDSFLVISQAKGDWEVQDERLALYHNCPKEFIKKFKCISFNYLPREDNCFADALASLGSAMRLPPNMAVEPIDLSWDTKPAYISSTLAITTEDD
ncbi:PREDICTED: uncharacterized protein LOC109114115 [Nelumbo nucifera]|uniref:Uncharacterized protein LOC109114115 n=1 Tax=Nelumbo nucifera TaxID=4432 RepID=A0A1U8Q1E4_NELNU|nr:PREDICTED: uncharacterized protein LOC109114115 [Nelumbo nucifera]